MAIWGVGVMLGPIMGPTLGGWLTDNYSWHWVFLINLPIGVLTVIGMVLFMTETPRHEHLRFDWFGFIALAVGIGSLQLMLDRGEQVGWFDSSEIWIETIVSIAGFYYFFAHSLTTRGALRALRNVQGPQFRFRLRVHGGDRRGAVRHHGAGDAVHAEPARLSRSRPPASCSARAASARC